MTPSPGVDPLWLYSEAARPWLELAEQNASSLSLAKRLRRELSPEQSRLVREQAELRRRAAAKFSRSREMFFTRLRLEQASGEAIAHYKAARFPADAPVADLCCGVGGDLLALAARGPAWGYDLDPVAAEAAAANLRAFSYEDSQILHADVEQFLQAPPLENATWRWHLDPDRRSSEGRRATRMEYLAPGPEFIERLRTKHPHGAVKLAPATVAPADWAEQAELEWIGWDGQCRQQMAWFGELAQHPGERSATVVFSTDRIARVHGSADSFPRIHMTAGRYVYEPHAAVRAAGLSGALAEKYHLAALGGLRGYLTGDARVEDDLLAGFEVWESSPLDFKRLNALLKARNIGRLEVKKREAPLTPEQILKRLKLRGEASAALLATTLGDSVTAILAKRL